MSVGVATGLVTNAVGRRVPTQVNGRESTPYQGVNSIRSTVEQSRSADSQQQRLSCQR